MTTVKRSGVPFSGNQRLLEHTWGSRATKNSWKHGAEGEDELKSSGALELAQQAVCSFFPLKKEGAFERPKALMGARQLPRLGQMRVGDAHHDRGPLEGVRGQRPHPFAAEAPAFWAWRPWQHCLIASQFWAERRAWGRACCKRFCKRQADHRY